jgi:hypothetical protein
MIAMSGKSANKTHGSKTAPDQFLLKVFGSSIETVVGRIGDRRRRMLDLVRTDQHQR